MFRLLLGFYSLCVVAAQITPSVTDGGRPLAPGLKVRFTKKGLDLANNVTGQSLNAAIVRAQLPNQSFIPVLLGNVDAVNMRLISFQANYSYVMLPPNRLEWSMRNARLTMQGQYTARIFFPTNVTTTSGVFTAQADEVNMTMTLIMFRAVDGRASVLDVICIDQVDKLKLDIDMAEKPEVKSSRMFQQWIGAVSDRLTIAVQLRLCEIARSFILNDINGQLKTYGPILTTLNPSSTTAPLVFDTSLTVTFPNPNISTAVVESNNKGEVSWRGFGATPFFPHDLATDVAGSDAVEQPRMLYYFGSDYILNSLFHHAYQQNLLHFELNGTSGAQTAKALRTSCFQREICLSTIFRDFRTRFPSGGSPIAIVRALKAPTLEFVDVQGVVRAEGTIEIRMPQTNPNANDVVVDPPVEHVATAELSFEGVFMPELQKMHVVGRLTGVNKVTIRSLISANGQQYDTATKQLVSSWAAVVLQELFNTYLGIGLPIPFMEGVELIEPSMRILPRTLRIDSDVRYAVIKVSNTNT